MDAHLFRLVCEKLAPLLKNGRIEKIQEPGPAHLCLTFYGGGQKRHLYFRFGRKAPFCFLSERRVTAVSTPSARIMRARRYLGGCRIASVVCQYYGRKIWLMAHSPQLPATPSGELKTVWLCLDLAAGFSLHFLSPDAIPQPDMPVWPEAAQLQAALESWRDWPVLTPALRKTLALLDKPEQCALLADLENGGGDIFSYSKNDKIMEVSAWPLPGALSGGYKETSTDDVLNAMEAAGRSLVFARLYEQQLEKEAAPGRKRQRRIRKLLDKLEMEEKRFSSILFRQAEVLLLKENFWRLDGRAHADYVELTGADGKAVKVLLDKRHDIGQNMERMFHQIGRAKRGLQILYERRSTLQRELQELEGTTTVHASEVSRPHPAVAGKKPLRKNSPRNVRYFTSSDGYVLLRGKDARGNLALRRMAAAHDLWVHVQDGPGAHVIIRLPVPCQVVPETTMLEAGVLAACKSWLCEAAWANVMYAEVRHVKPCRSGPAGKMIIDKIHTTRTVSVDRELEKRLADPE